MKRYGSLGYARLYDRLRAYDGGTQPCEMERLVRAGGTIATLCSAKAGGRDYLSRLETTHGFHRTLFNASWRFPVITTAQEVILFFFGEETWKEYRSRWPEDFVTHCGVWWR